MGPLSHNPKQLEGSVASQPHPSCWPVAVPTYRLSLELLIALTSLGSLGQGRASGRVHVFRCLGGRTALIGRLLLFPFCSLPSKELGFKS